MPDIVETGDGVSYIPLTLQTGETTEASAGGSGGRKDPLQGGTVRLQTVQL